MWVNGCSFKVGSSSILSVVIDTFKNNARFPCYYTAASAATIIFSVHPLLVGYRLLLNKQLFMAHQKAHDVSSASALIRNLSGR